MSEITRKDVEYVAKLSRIALSREEEEQFVTHLREIVSYVGKLGELDKELVNVSPTLHAWENKGTLLREDELEPSINRQDVFVCAPHHKGEFFTVPKVIE